ncbi:unnamed protein product [Hermetia illucens]|uniref:RNA helicase aquarius N-terminal domain-containing protein n=1 Tax=Hermetia illucens TaxID=343691 RepID=A0A7R8V486_HERIL|nr:unnamed protein product [Hermetia illucens]
MTKKENVPDAGSKTKIPVVTVSQINADVISQLANVYWSPETQTEHRPFDASVIENVYTNEIANSKHSVRRVMMLEFSQYLENYLWPNYKAESSSHAHMMSIVVMVNEKFRERVPVWSLFEGMPDEFPGFFHNVLKTCLDSQPLTASYVREQTALLLFLNHCFNSMEVEICRDQAKRLVSLSMWACLQQKRRDQELRNIPEWRKFWKKLQKKENSEKKVRLDWERHFLQNLIIKFLQVLESIPKEGPIEEHLVIYCERFLEFLIDLEALLPTRRFFNTVLDDCHLVVRCQLSTLCRRDEGKLFAQFSNPQSTK